MLMRYSNYDGNSSTVITTINICYACVCETVVKWRAGG